MLMTFSFQAAAFYQRDGFETVAERNPTFLVVTKDADIVERLREAGLNQLLDHQVDG